MDRLKKDLTIIGYSEKEADVLIEKYIKWGKIADLKDFVSTKKEIMGRC